MQKEALQAILAYLRHPVNLGKRVNLSGQILPATSKRYFTVQWGSFTLAPGGVQAYTLQVLPVSGGGDAGARAGTSTVPATSSGFVTLGVVTDGNTVAVSVEVSGYEQFSEVVRLGTKGSLQSTALRGGYAGFKGNLVKIINTMVSELPNSRLVAQGTAK